ncbi:hypothetical protein D0T12_02605 [Actinomadura spongiicola]|uniref:Uncharacterized protein n=1 Tax=Actinomadura spongiicola TaxID=2303421 RepID=A0A372GP41_9ACTN|nr:hypothetical protein [Actinomadura spongiicola]RFS87156.1 hypothetical protein D0T12_02605 [Actinomadura spongiicola]
MLRGVHVLVEINDIPLLNSYHDGISHVIGVHPETFFAPDSALFHNGENQQYLPLGDPIDGCAHDCCGAGVAVCRQGARVHWRLIGDNWNRHLPSTELTFDREEYLFTIEWARDTWIAQEQ